MVTVVSKHESTLFFVAFWAARIAPLVPRLLWTMFIDRHIIRHRDIVIPVGFVFYLHLAVRGVTMAEYGGCDGRSILHSHPDDEEDRVVLLALTPIDLGHEGARRHRKVARLGVGWRAALV